jgi:hypothetical protein
MKHIARVKDEPQRYAWPVLLYGPKLIERVGRDRLLDAPVWAVEELAWGGIWLQATENPFTAKPAELKALAKHLALEVAPIKD